MDDLKQRLAALRHNGQFAIGGGTVSSDGKATSWGGEKIMVLANPDGPEALAHIEALEARNAALEAGLRPFAEALADWGDDNGQPDRWSVWEHPLGLNITIGDCRHARTLLNEPAGGEG